MPVIIKAGLSDRYKVRICIRAADFLNCRLVIHILILRVQCPGAPKVARVLTEECPERLKLRVLAADDDSSCQPGLFHPGDHFLPVLIKLF